jgi:hypothetical protein
MRTSLEAADGSRHFYLSSEEIRKPGDEGEDQNSEDHCRCNDSDFPPVDGHVESQVEFEAILLLSPALVLFLFSKLRGA